MMIQAAVSAFILWGSISAIRRQNQEAYRRAILARLGVAQAEGLLYRLIHSQERKKIERLTRWNRAA